MRTIPCAPECVATSAHFKRRFTQLPAPPVEATQVVGVDQFGLSRTVQLINKTDQLKPDRCSISLRSKRGTQARAGLWANIFDRKNVMVKDL
jgi:hypothetical protein